MKKIAIIGAGPAGICAALSAAQMGHHVDLYDKNEKIGKKLFITGKGRCNLTNDCEPEDFFQNVVTNPRFMYSAFYTFPNTALKSLIEENGCPLKTERGNRVFPESDKSSDIIQAFKNALARAKVNIHLESDVKTLVKNGDTITGFTLASGETIQCDHLILATGGKSYQSTGSDGFGYELAKSVGHRIVPPKPALTGINIVQDWPKKLQGLSLRNVELTLFIDDKKKETLMGEMLFTHFGISGPLVLTMSSLINQDPKKARFEIDLKPALNMDKLEKRLMRDFEKYQNKNYVNALSDLLPAKMVNVIVALSNIDPHKKVNQISKEERRQIADLLKHLKLSVYSLQAIDSAIVTAGGVSVKEINPSTMASKKVKGLSFAGEMIDVDAVTGGFNIQVAASTGFLAGMIE